MQEQKGMNDIQPCVTGLCSPEERSEINSACCAAIGNACLCLGRKSGLCYLSEGELDMYDELAGRVSLGGIHHIN